MEMEWITIWVICLGCTAVGMEEPYFVRQPESQTIAQYQEVRLHCATEPPASQVTWWHNGQLLSTFSMSPKLLSNGDLYIWSFKYTRTSLVEVSDDGVYVCLANVTAVGVLRSREAVLSKAYLEAFSSSIGNLKVNATEGNVAVIPCTPPAGAPKPVVSYQLNGQALQFTDRHSLLPNGNLHILNVKQSDHGQYKCVATNPVNSVKQTANHFVNLQVLTPTVNTAPYFVSAQKQSYEVVAGSDITMECVLHGSPVPRIYWNKENANLPEGRAVEAESFIIIKNAETSDSGTYVCVGNNGIGTTQFDLATLQVKEPPVIFTQPTNQVGIEGASVTFRCFARGLDVRITWYFNGDEVRPSGAISVTGTSLIIQGVTKKQAGIYQCFARSALGLDTSLAYLKVLGPSEHNYSWPNLPDFGQKLTTTMASSRQGDPGRVDPDEEDEEPNDLNPDMVPPTVPEITQLTANSVRVSWTVPENDGLPITVFRIQYKEVSARNKQDKRWVTVEDLIEPSARDYRVSNLKAGAQYKFRIAAIYSNNASNESPITRRFTMEVLSARPETPAAKPLIVQAKVLGPDRIALQWRVESDELVDGFRIIYKPFDSDQVFKEEEVLGKSTNTYTLKDLQPDTEYSIIIKSYTSAGSGPPSNSVAAKTTAIPTGNSSSNVPQLETAWPPQTATPTKLASGATVWSRQPPSDASLPRQVTTHYGTNTGSSNELLYILLGVVLGIMILILIVFVVMCLLKQRQHRRQTAGKSKYSEVPKPIYTDTLPKVNGRGGGPSFLLHDLSSNNGLMGNGYVNSSTISPTGNVMFSNSSMPAAMDKCYYTNQWPGPVQPSYSKTDERSKASGTATPIYSNPGGDTGPANVYYQVEPYNQQTSGTLGRRVQMGTFGCRGERSRPNSRADLEGSLMIADLNTGHRHLPKNRHSGGEGSSGGSSLSVEPLPGRNITPQCDHIPRIHELTYRPPLASSEESRGTTPLNIYEHIKEGSLQRRPFPRTDSRDSSANAVQLSGGAHAQPPQLPPRNVSLLPSEQDVAEEETEHGLLKTISQEVIPSDTEGSDGRSSTPSLLEMPLSLDPGTSYSSQPLTHTNSQSEHQPFVPIELDEAGRDESKPLMVERAHMPRANDYPSDEEES